jgi:hypothetical protein
VFTGIHQIGFGGIGFGGVWSPARLNQSLSHSDASLGRGQALAQEPLPRPVSAVAAGRFAAAVERGKRPKAWGRRPTVADEAFRDCGLLL